MGIVFISPLVTDISRVLRVDRESSMSYLRVMAIALPVGHTVEGVESGRLKVVRGPSWFII